MFHSQGTEEASAAAAAAAAPSGDEEKAVDAAAPVTNGTNEEVKTNGEQAAAPVATPEESVTPPSNGDSKPIVEAAKETVDEVIVAASKSVDEKLNSVAKPEVNKNADQDLQEQTHTQTALETADNEHEQSLSSEKANIDTIPNNNIVVETIDTSSVGVVVDCTNNSSNNDNDNINSQSAPPLPDSPPPSQITVFAESAMSVDLAQVENPQTIPVIETETKIQSNSALVGDTKIELAIPESVAADAVVESPLVDEKSESVVVVEPVNVEIEDEQLATSNETNAPQSEIETQIQTDNVETKIESQIEPELPKPDEEIAETIAILDRVNLNESDVKPVENVVTETNTETLSADISSPLPQNSLDTLPSPQSLSSNVTPPNEIDESATVELSNEQEDASSLPPPPPIDDDIVALEKSTIEQSGFDATINAAGDASATQNGNDDSLPPPPVQELIENEIHDELKTNGINVAVHVHDQEQNHSVEAQSGDGILNGSAKEHDEAANNITDKVITTIYETNALRTH